MKTVTITVTGYLTVTVTAPDKGYVNRDVYIYATWTPATFPPFSYDVDFGDGTPHAIGSVDTGNSTPTLIHKYASAGTFTIKATVTDSAGQTGSGTKSITIATLLVASLSPDKTSGSPPLTVTFTCGASGGFTPYSWTLDYGDGTSPDSGSGWNGSSFTRSHTYNKVGTYTVTFTVNDSGPALALAASAVSAGSVAEWLAVPGPLVVGALLAFASRSWL